MDSDTRNNVLHIEQLKGFILSECFHTAGQYALSNGEITDYYIDCRVLPSIQLTRSHLTKSLSYFAQKSIRGKKVRQPISYIGMETGGIALALLAAVQDGVLFGYLRKEVKDHGMQNMLEHYQSVVNGILFDDVINSGETIKKALDNTVYFRCYSIVCIANRNPNLKTINDIPINSILSYDEIRKMREYELKKYSGEMNDIGPEKIFKEV